VAEDVLRSYVSLEQDDWDKLLPMVEFAMNNAPSESTGQTPFMLNYGINPRHPDISKLISAHAAGITVAITKQQTQACAVRAMLHTFRCIPDVPAANEFNEAMQKAITHTKLRLQSARQRMIQQTDDKRTLDVPFKQGEQVMLSTKNLKLKHGCNKLMPRFVGPFTVSAQISPVAFRLELPKTMRIHNVFHTSLLKPWKQREGEETPHPPAILIDEADEYEVDTLIGRRQKTISSRKKKHAADGKKRTIRIQYLVRWLGYGPEHDEWIHEAELIRHCSHLVKSYDRKHPRPPPPSP
jgi:hypothetical protein